MNDRSCLAIVLAAGEGTRMRSALPKVLHPVGGRPMLAHVLTAAETAGADRLAVVIGHGQDVTRPVVERTTPYGACYVQEERRGTAHAVLSARPALESGADDVVVLCGDAPLIRPETIRRVRNALARGSDLVVVGFEAVDPTGYGRLIVENGRLVAIREEKDAGLAERMVRLCNSGILGFRGEHLPELLDGITDQNAKREFYLTDAVAIANERGLRVSVEIASEEEVLGVNDRAQLATAEAVFQRRARTAALTGGVTLIAPETVWFSFDTILGRDVLVEPNVVFGPGVIIGDGATIHAFSHLEGAIVGEQVSVGPFARLRPGTHLAEGARVGNFVEIKNSSIEEGAKVNHLTYIGDARVGAAANIGAGTITCNYDGFGKHHTDIGAHAFIGSNSALVAPVIIGDGAFVASGSVVTENVPADALAVARGRQATRPGWAAGFRAEKAAARAEAAAATAATGLAAVALAGLATDAFADTGAPEPAAEAIEPAGAPAFDLPPLDLVAIAPAADLPPVHDEPADALAEEPADAGADYDEAFLDAALDAALADAFDDEKRAGAEPDTAPVPVDAELLPDEGTDLVAPEADLPRPDAAEAAPAVVDLHEAAPEEVILEEADHEDVALEDVHDAAEPAFAAPHADAADAFMADLDLERLMGAALAAEVMPEAGATAEPLPLDGFEDAFLAEALAHEIDDASDPDDVMEEADRLPEDLPEDEPFTDDALPEELLADVEELEADAERHRAPAV